MLVCKCYGTDGPAILMKGLMMDKRLNRALLAGLLAPWHPCLPPFPLKRQCLDSESKMMTVGSRLANFTETKAQT